MLIILDDKIRKYSIKYIMTFIDITNPIEQPINIWPIQRSTGKSKIKNLLNATLGSYSRFNDVNETID